MKRSLLSSGLPLRRRLELVVVKYQGTHGIQRDLLLEGGEFR